jgi:phospholipase/carboxylesterase
MKVKDAALPAQACVIWLHGLGSEGADMMGLAGELPLTLPVRHVCLDAPIRPVTFNNGMQMRAWYDIVGFSLSDREDREGIETSERLINEVIETQLAAGFTAQQIYLAGFSQGGAMALFAGVRSPHALGGLISLSAYLPLASTIAPALHLQTPIFVGAGMHDQVVLPAWTAHGVQWLQSQGYSRVEKYDYPIEHTVSFDEVHEIARWLTTHASTTIPTAGEV